MDFHFSIFLKKMQASDFQRIWQNNKKRELCKK